MKSYMGWINFIPAILHKSLPAFTLIRYMFFQNEKQIVEIMLEKITSLYGYDPIIANFLSFLKRHRKEVFLYLQDPIVEKTSDIAEQHFSIQSWLFKHRFKTKEGLLKTSF